MICPIYCVICIDVICISVMFHGYWYIVFYIDMLHFTFCSVHAQDMYNRLRRVTGSQFARPRNSIATYIPSREMLPTKQYVSMSGLTERVLALRAHSLGTVTIFLMLFKFRWTIYATYSYHWFCENSLHHWIFVSIFSKYFDNTLSAQYFELLITCPSRNIYACGRHRFQMIFWKHLR